jgi:potassium channel subfamily K, other eukaryote
LIISFTASLFLASTIGLGDLTPKTRNARLFAIAFIPLGVAAAGEVLSGVAEAMVQRRQIQLYESQLKSDFTIEHLQIMDGNADGQISREEYVEFMLKEMERVSQVELDELHTQFGRLDVDKTGFLTMKI